MAETFTLPPEFDKLFEILKHIKGKLFVLALWAGAVFMAGFYVSSRAIEWLKDLLLPTNAQIVVLSPIELILLQIKFATFAAGLAILPPLAYLLYKYAAENLEIELDFEIKWSQGVALLLLALLLFVVGITYALDFMLPLLLDYLYTSATASGLQVTYSLGEFLHFVLVLTLALGLTFQLPLVVWLLVKTGVVEYHQLAEYRRHVFLTFFILAAFITPPDILSQLILALPMSILFELSLLIMRLLDREGFLAAKGLRVALDSPYPRPTAILLTIYGALVWLGLAIGFYGLFWFSYQNKWPGSPSADWLLTRPELLENSLLLALPLVLVLTFNLALGLRDRLSLKHLQALRPLAWMSILVTTAWVAPEENYLPAAFLLLACPLLLAYEVFMALFRSAAIVPLPAKLREENQEELRKLPQRTQSSQR